MWPRVLENLQSVVTRPSFETWLKDTDCVAIIGTTVFVRTPNTFIASMLEERMYSLVRSALSDVLGYDVEPEFVVSELDEAPQQTVSTS